MDALVGAFLDTFLDPTPTVGDVDAMRGGAMGGDAMGADESNLRVAALDLVEPELAAPDLGVPSIAGAGNHGQAHVGGHRHDHPSSHGHDHVHAQSAAPVAVARRHSGASKMTDASGVGISLLRMSVAARLGLAVLVIGAMWGIVILALT